MLDAEYIEKLEQFLNNCTVEEIIKTYKDIPECVIKYLTKSN